ncbi:MAG: hypothetical protein SGI92_20840 [Bryobacteraceae bacterium]|nr:hypothetical protein [Bryobacteraceae bacterium]
MCAQTPEWRRIGTSTVSRGLASPAGGPVARVWYSADGQILYARTSSGRTFQTTDFEKWAAAAPGTEPAGPPARVASHPLRNGRSWRAGQFAWRSDDGGRTWINVSGFRGKSILGDELTDVAVSPATPDEVTLAGGNGVWRSVDGGVSWAGLNDSLPNLPVARLLALPDAEPSVRILLNDGAEALWNPGDRGWQPAPDSLLAREAALKASVPSASVTAAIRNADVVYGGTADGRLIVSTDRGQSWRESPAVAGAGRIERLYSDSRDSRFALAITSSRQAARVLRTVNAGVFWDDITSDLPAGAVRGIAADRLTGAVYVASDTGIFVTYTDALAASPATPWTRLRNEAAVDVLLDGTGNQLYAAFEGLGVWATMAPHRLRDPKVVSAGDRVLRSAAPGSLLSVIGARIESARAGNLPAAILASGENESQVQLPWDLSGSAVMVSMTSGAGNRIQIGLPLAPASPSIFVDRDGIPLITNADSGLVLDAATPARSGARIQILASGLGRVTPDWPTGLAAPLQDPPKVVLPVRAWLDRESLEVTLATLAPGYIGLYLIELQLPSIVNRGPAEFYIEAGNAQSNRVRVWLEP